MTQNFIKTQMLHLTLQPNNTETANRIQRTNYRQSGNSINTSKKRAIEAFLELNYDEIAATGTKKS